MQNNMHFVRNDIKCSGFVSKSRVPETYNLLFPFSNNNSGLNAFDFIEDQLAARNCIQTKL